MYETVILVLFIVVASLPAFTCSVTKATFATTYLHCNYVIADYTPINVSPSGGGGGGAGYPQKLDVFENLGSLKFPTHESQVCVKNPQEVP